MGIARVKHKVGYTVRQHICKDCGYKKEIENQKNMVDSFLFLQAGRGAGGCFERCVFCDSVQNNLEPIQPGDKFAHMRGRAICPECLDILKSVLSGHVEKTDMPRPLFKED